MPLPLLCWPRSLPFSLPLFSQGGCLQHSLSVFKSLPCGRHPFHNVFDALAGGIPFPPCPFLCCDGSCSVSVSAAQVHASAPLYGRATYSQPRMQIVHEGTQARQVCRTRGSLPSLAVLSRRLQIWRRERPNRTWRFRSAFNVCRRLQSRAPESSKMGAAPPHRKSSVMRLGRHCD